jgi:hypothetical protein
VASSYDLRAAVKEQVKSLGAKFVGLDVKGGATEDKRGYAKAMDEAFYRRQRELMTEVLRETDVAITTAAVPGRRAHTDYQPDGGCDGARFGDRGYRRLARRKPRAHPPRRGGVA